MPRKPKTTIRQTEVQREVFGGKSGFTIKWGYFPNWFTTQRKTMKYFEWKNIKFSRPKKGGKK